MDQATLPAASCEVCNSQPPNAGELLTCSKCNLHVHEKCFAVNPTSSAYVCSECDFVRENLDYWGESDLDDNTVCSLCPITRKSKPGMKILMRNKRRLGYAHALCGMFLPQAAISERHVDISQVKLDGTAMERCVLCNTQVSCSTKCSFPECGIWVHATCAALAHEQGFELNFSTLSLACPCHSTMAVRFPQKAEEFLRRMSSGAQQLSAANSPAPTAQPPAATNNAKKKPGKRKLAEKTCDKTWLDRRVSLIADETVGTVVDIAVEKNKYIVALDDGVTKVERGPEEVNLIPKRAPGCNVCKNASSTEDVLLCDLCDVEHHLNCAKPPLKQIPEGKWFCEDCTRKRKKRQDELAAQAKAQAKAAKQEKKPKLAAAEDDDEEEYDDKKKPSSKKRSSLRLKSKTPGAAASVATAPAAAAATEDGKPATPAAGGGVCEEQDIDFDARFPELSVEDWCALWDELVLVQRTEVAAFQARFSLQSAVVRGRARVLVSKFHNSELPKKCLEGYLLMASRFPVWSTEEEKQALEQCVGHPLERADNYTLPPLPPTTLATTPIELPANQDFTQQTVEAARAKCEDSLICIDFSTLTSAAPPLQSPTREYFYLLAEVMEKLRLDCERVFSRATLPAFRARELFRRLQPKLKLLRDTEFKLDANKPFALEARKPLYQVLNEYQCIRPLPEHEVERTMLVLDTVKQAPHTEPTATRECTCFTAHLGCANRNPELELGHDVAEVEAWGFDSCTRKFLDFCLETCAGLKSPQTKNLIVDSLLKRSLFTHGGELKPALEACIAALFASTTTTEHSFLDMLRGLQAIKLTAEMLGIPIRSKGQGICAQRALPPQTFVAAYLGELYPPWRWFERQDNVKQAQNKLGFKPPVPELLPVVLERHDDDPRGYDVLFVDPTVRGNFASRVQHSCEPNCKLQVVAVDGKYQVAMYTLRAIAEGEELTLNRSRSTEEETEYRSAICLCGSAECRGAFLTWTGSTSSFSSTTTDTLANSHGFLDRVSLLLMASMESERFDEEGDRLARFALGESIFSQNSPEAAPAWIRKWAAYILRFVEHENEPTQARRQNLAITVNKILYFLRCCDTQEHPLRCLQESEVLEFLWTGADSVAKRAMESSRRAELPQEFQSKVDEMVMGHKPANSSEARALLQELGALFWAHPHSFCENCGDVLLMYALTETWFTATQYQGFKSAPLSIRNVDVGRDTAPLSSTKQVEKAAPPPVVTPVAPAAVSVGTVECSKEQLMRIHYSNTGEKQRISKDQPLMRGKTLTVLSTPLPGTIQIRVHRDAANGHCSVVPPGCDVQEVYFSFHAYPDDSLLGNLQKVTLKSYEQQDKEFTFQTIKDTKLIKYLVPGEEPSSSSMAAVAQPKPSAAAAPAATKKEPVPPALRVVFSEPKKYQAGFAWGQLVGWWKQTVSDPSASLSAERRGSLSLPDIETCFSKDHNSMERFQKCRRDMLKKIKEKPDGMWPVTWPYSFRNKDKIYGSPWFDDALETARAGDFTRRMPRGTKFLQIVNEHLENANQ